MDVLQQVSSEERGGGPGSPCSEVNNSSEGQSYKVGVDREIIRPLSHSSNGHSGPS